VVLLTVLASLWVVVAVCAILHALDADRLSRRVATGVFFLALAVALVGGVQGDYDPYCCESYQLDAPATASPIFAAALVVLAVGLVLWLIVRGLLGLRSEGVDGGRGHLR
jgi:hypothetical protein